MSSSRRPASTSSAPPLPLPSAPNDQTAFRSAFIHVAVQILGVGFMLLVYTNMALLQPYIGPILWAMLVSTALHRIRHNTSEWIKQRTDLKANETSSSPTHSSATPAAPTPTKRGRFAPAAVGKVLGRAVVGRSLWLVRDDRQSFLVKLLSVFVLGNISWNVLVAIGAYNLMVVVVIVIVAMLGLVLLYTLQRGVVWLLHATGLWTKLARVASAIARLLSPLTRLICFLCTRSCNALLGHIHTNAIPIASVLVMLSCFFCVASLGVFFFFQCGKEGRDALSATYTFINDWITQNEQLNRLVGNPRLMQQVYESGIHWADTKWNATFGTDVPMSSVLDWLQSLRHNTTPNTLSTEFSNGTTMAHLTSHNTTIVQSSAFSRFMQQLPHTNLVIETFSFEGVHHLTYEMLSRVPQEIAHWLVKLFTLHGIEFDPPAFFQKALLSLSNLSSSLATNGVQVVSLFFGLFLNFLLGLVTSVIDVVIFASTLYYLLCAEEDIPTTIMEYAPMNPEKKKNLKKRVQECIQGVFVLSITVFCTHAAFTWFVFTVLRLHFAYLYAFWSGLLAVIPFVPAYTIGFIGALQLLLMGDPSWPSCGITLVCSHLFIALAFDSAAMQQHLPLHPYITSLSIVLGLYAYDMKGAFIGPLVVSAMFIIVEAYKDVFMTVSKEPKKSKQ